MREILFRGKLLTNWDEWIEGAIMPHDYERCTIFRQNPFSGSLEGREVYLNTVGQYTGLKDKDGKKIFEGDFLRWKGGYFILVEWDPTLARFDGKLIESGAYFNPTVFGECEIVGNIHDNPELMEGSYSLTNH